MKRAIVALALLAGACTSPLTPTTPTHSEPLALSGPTTWACETQPRTYCLDDDCRVEVDHYESDTPCPDVPID